ncbi:MAG: ferredoxin, partial [Pseudomonadota bacterium]
AHAAEIRALAERHPATVMRTAFSRPGPDDIVGRDCDWTGRLTAERVLETVDDPGAHYLLCGPPAFVAALRGGLLEAGIREDRLVEETF